MINRNEGNKAREDEELHQSFNWLFDLTLKVLFLLAKIKVLGEHVFVEERGMVYAAPGDLWPGFAGGFDPNAAAQSLTGVRVCVLALAARFSLLAGESGENAINEDLVRCLRRNRLPSWIGGKSTIYCGQQTSQFAATDLFGCTGIIATRHLIQSLSAIFSGRGSASR